MLTYLPQSSRHCEQTQNQIRNGQSNNEYIPGSSHALPTQNSPQDQDVATKSHQDE